MLSISCRRVETERARARKMRSTRDHRLHTARTLFVCVFRCEHAPSGGARAESIAKRYYLLKVIMHNCHSNTATAAKPHNVCGSCIYIKYSILYMQRRTTYSNRHEPHTPYCRKKRKSARIYTSNRASLDRAQHLVPSRERAVQQYMYIYIYIH